jgi:ribosome-binding ATPase YchF (GTP1/OBG family)
MLSCGIVGLPNAGKSTLFNALAERRLAQTAPRPFTTIEPHEAMVGVPDPDLKKLSELVKPDVILPASVTFIDIAGLVKGAHQGEGLGNQFLGKVREVDVIVHVVRAFSDSFVTHAHPTHEPGSLEQALEDIEIVNVELELAGIVGKHVIYVLNFDEKQLKDPIVQQYIAAIENKFRKAPIVVSAKLEEELTDLTPSERVEFLREMGIKESGLEKLIKDAYKTLDLITFYTIKGGKEVHAWSIKAGSNALEAAGTVHTDFAKSFIKAEVISVSSLLTVGGWKEASEKGEVRLEGKEYRVQDKDVIEFKTGA